MTRLAGVLGWPVAHSRSPAIHGHWLAQHGLDGAYLPLPVHPDRLETALRGLSALGFRGANVTVPHKVATCAAMDRLDAVAGRIGAVNTIICHDDGSLEGRNTDAYGFSAALTQAVPDWRPAAAPAVVLGAGGAARAVVVALLDAGVPALRLCNRSREKAEALAAALGGPIEIIAWEDRASALAGAGLVVNTTSLGMTGKPPLEIDLDDLPAAAVVTDIVYTPLETSLLAAARGRGNPVVDGLGMLLHQAVPGFAAWYGTTPHVTPELYAAIAASL